MFARRRWIRGLGASALLGLSTRVTGVQAQTPRPTPTPGSDPQSNPKPNLGSDGGAAPATPRAARPAAARGGRVLIGNGPTRLALLLETQSPNFERAAQAVLGGVRAAMGVNGSGFSVELLPIGEGDDQIQRLAQELDARGFVGAIGPLTRDNVNLLCDLGNLPVPLLALNLPDPDRHVAFNMAFFSLAIEGEAAQAAQIAHDEALARVGRARPIQALPVGDGTALSRRGLAAFQQQWLSRRGVLVDPVEIDPTGTIDWRAALAEARADVALVAVSPDNLRLVRAALRAETPIFGTSQLNAVQGGVAQAGKDLDGVRFVDMPWQVLPESPIVAAYPRDQKLRHLDFQRLYALGIDACRVAIETTRGEPRFEVDGVTGWLRIDVARDLRVSRSAVLAEFRNGLIVPVRA